MQNQSLQNIAEAQWKVVHFTESFKSIDKGMCVSKHRLGKNEH